METIDRRVFCFLKGKSQEQLKTLEEKACEEILLETTSLYQIASNIAAWISYDFYCWSYFQDSDASFSSGAFESQVIQLLGSYVEKILHNNLDIGLSNFFEFVKKARSLTDDQELVSFELAQFEQSMLSVAKILYRNENSRGTEISLSWRDISPPLEANLHPIHRYMLDTWATCVKNPEDGSILFIFGKKDVYEGLNWEEILGRKNFYFVFDPSRKAKLDMALGNETKKMTYIDRAAGESTILHAKKLILAHFPGTTFYEISRIDTLDETDQVDE